MISNPAKHLAEFVKASSKVHHKVLTRVAMRTARNLGDIKGHINEAIEARLIYLDGDYYKPGV